MKKINIALILSLTVLLFGGCAKSYLDTEPTSSTGPGTLFETTQNAAVAVNGINKLMYRQLMSSQGYNGEGTIRLYFGEYPGDGMYVANLTGWSNTINSEYHEKNTDPRDYYAWWYYYMLIANANSILANIENAEGPNAEKEFITAQALTYRAYSYMMLVQIYAYRWKDSNGGNVPAVPLRLDTSIGDIALSSLAECYAQIYKDLDDAIKLFNQSGLDRDEEWKMGLPVAYATYAKAALNREDYATALEMAKKARKDYPLMSNKDYKAGFCNPTNEWIWYLYGSLDETLYWYGYFAYVAYCSTASQVKNYPKCISKELYHKFPKTDVRTELFLDPLNYTYTKSTGFATSSSTTLQAYGRSYAKADGRKGIESAAKVCAYMQFKFANNEQGGVGHFPLIRASEMVLIEAEANYFLKKYTDAQASLIELNKTSGRDPEYTCTKTGEDLLNEIKDYRKFELWGEGANWFDLKRWGDPLVRHNPDEGGNFMNVFAVSYGPEAKNKWTWVIPLKETQANGLID
ncbi:MAG: RagB/SusD family nutrient uptake outer membrane protein [Bacteroidales bacterium]|nr:RagB/SusD family nutrient uptake outer membrane protein [Bacteroidales bacterium]